MVLDFVSKLDNHDQSLEEDIELALKALGNRNVLVHTNRNVSEYIDVNDILFILKEKSKNKCIVKTIDNKIIINDSLLNVEKKLTNIFCKIHRSCIVNTKYIKKVDYNEQIIYFINDNKLCNLIAQSKNKKLKKALNES